MIQGPWIRPVLFEKVKVEVPMTQTAPPTRASAAAASRDVQRENLEQIVQLSIECTAEEQRIEQEHTDALTRENAEYQKKTAATAQKHQRRHSELAATTKQRHDAIQNRYESRRQAAMATNQKAQFQVTRTREEAESALKKQVEQGTWQAESQLVAFEMRLDTSEQKSKKELESSLADLGSLEVSVRDAMTRFGLTPFPVETLMDDALKQRVAAGPQAVLAEHRQNALALMQDLRVITQPRVADDVMFFVLILATSAIAAVVAWILPHDPTTKILAAVGAGLLALVLGIVAWQFYRVHKRRKIEANAKSVYVPAMQSIAIGCYSARAELEAAAAARERRVAEARQKRDDEVNAARDLGKSQQSQAIEHYRTAVADEALRHKNQLAAIEQEKDHGLEQLQQHRAATTRQIDEEDAQARQDAETQHAVVLETIASKYDRECRTLATRWDDGLRTMTNLLAVGSGIDPKLIDWSSPAWEHWKAPAEFSGQVRFGEMKVDLAQLTEQLPKRLRLPESFSVPAMLVLPNHASLLVETDHAGRAAGIDAAQMVMARLLTQMPGGRVKFTIFDPVGLGQSFAGFMHLVDHDESLVGTRIWTEKEHIQQRLADLTEHMETVIQKYLRNEYETIDEYNAQAGELAEPFRFLIIADFPTGFEQEALRRLTSIATTGPRCGVYTIILRDTRQPIPPGVRMEEIIARSVRLIYKNDAFTWDDAVFKRFPLRMDPPPSEELLTRLMDLVGKSAKEAKRVEVPFQSIAPTDDQFWTMSSKNDLRVPLGKSGATRLQSLRLGVGVAQHVLVAGKTGSGKSNLMHTIVTNLAMWYGPDEVEFYLVDFKKGVEFKAYATSQLPHARAIAVESDREFGLSVLQRVDAELSRRGTLFREAGVQEISAYRDRTNLKLPRTILLIDEFQEFFSEDDKLGQEASGLLDRLVRQGRAFGIHVVLGSQTIGGTSGLARSTLGQIAVRVALQCTEADSQMILGYNNSSARLLSRPGEAIYNDAGGLVENNSPFQIAFLPDEQREGFLHHVRLLSQARAIAPPTPIVFEGNTAAAIRKNPRLMSLLESPAYPPAASSVPAYIGEPVAIKEPTAVNFRRQSGANVLLVGQQEESAIAICASMIASLAAQHKPGDALFYIMDGSPTDSRYFGLLERVTAALPHTSKNVAWRDVPDAINELATMVKERQGDDAHAGPAVYLLMFGLQRYRLLRHQEDDFSFKRDDEPAAPKPDKQFAELLSEGPPLGLHTIIWADTPITLERTFERSSMRQFDNRILFQMSASDSSNLIDSPLANLLGTHRALLYSEEQGTFEKCRPYEVPDETWLAFLADHLKKHVS